MITKIKGGGEKIQKFLSGQYNKNREAQGNVANAVYTLLNEVQKFGNKALREQTKKFDKIDVTDFEISRSEIEERAQKADPKLYEVMQKSAENIRAFHEKQLKDGYRINGEDGVILGQTVRGLERVGIYVPGGTALYPSSVLMNAIPAKIAGVKEIIMVTPPQKDRENLNNLLAAAEIAGVDRVFTVGGAQACAALAFGTESIPRVDKIVGPGNAYVAAAKRALYGIVDIDIIAGPSEICIIADETADPVFIAADMLSQAEHDRLASSVLITTSEDIADRTIEQLKIQINKLARKETAEFSLRNFGAAIICEDYETAVAAANYIAPEHLELMTKEPFELLPTVKNAGSVFLGAYSPEPLGDYYAGPNHVLPTSGTARFFSPLGVDAFLKKSSYIYYTKEALQKAADGIMLFAGSEGLSAHAASIGVRFNEQSDK